VSLQGAGEQTQRLLIILALSLVCLLVSFLVPQVKAVYLFVVLIGLVMLGAAFFSPQIGLALLVISMLLSPEFGGGGLGGGGQESVRGFVVRVDDILLLLIGVGWFARGAIHKDLGLFRKSPLNRPIAAYLVVCLFSTLLGAAFGNVRWLLGFFFVVRYFEYIVVLYMVLNYVDDLKQIKLYTYLAFAVCIIVAIIAISQIPSGERVSAPFEGERGEPNTLGGYLVFFIAIGLGLALNTLKMMRRLLYLGFVGLVSMPFLFTLSRASWLGALPMWLTLTFLSRRTKFMLAVTAILFIVGPAIAPTSVQQRATLIFKQRAQSGQAKVAGVRIDTSTSARLSTWGSAVDGWKEAPIFGHGITGFSFMDAQYFRVLAETGILGIAAFLWLLYSVFQVGWRAYRVCREDEWLGGLALGYLAGFFALLIHAIGSNTFIILRIMEPFWLFTGLVMVGTEIKERELVEAKAGKPAFGLADSPPGGDEDEKREQSAGLKPTGSTLRPKAIP
jgi:O-antigen ligase